MPLVFNRIATCVYTHITNFLPIHEWTANAFPERTIAGLVLYLLKFCDSQCSAPLGHGCRDAFPSLATTNICNTT